MKLGRHTLFNLVGLATPLLAAAVAIPFLIRTLGDARFGLLSLIWAVVSYFSLFDLGLGRALTQRLAAALGQTSATDRQIAEISGTACALMTALGLVAGLGLAALAPWAVAWVRDVPDKAEATMALQWMALAVPAVVLTTGLRGLMEARNAFAMVNLLRLPLGLLTFLGPVVVVVFWTTRLDAIAMALALGRWVALAAHAWGAWYTTPVAQRLWLTDKAQVTPLLRAGGWLTVGSLTGPIMGYADRFIIATGVSASAVAFYATPHELVTKLWIIPGALTAVLFPAFAAKTARGDADTWPLLAHSVRWLFVVMLPISLTLALFSNELLSAWISPAFAAPSAPILQWLSLGILINCMAHVPLSLLQGAGDARGPALLQLAQAVPYIALMGLAVLQFGINAAAALWAARMAFDTAAMFWLCARRFGRTSVLWPDMRTVLAIAISAAGFTLALLDATSIWRLGAALTCAVAVAFLLRPWDTSAARH